MPLLIADLSVFSDQGNTRVFVTDTHTTSKPEILKQSRRIPQGNSTVAVTSFSGTIGTVNTDGAPIAEKFGFELSVRTPINGAVADKTALITLLTNLVNDPNFVPSIDKQTFIKAG